MSFIFSTHQTRAARKERISDWIGYKKRNISDISKEDVDWKDVHTNIKQMDQIYDATFYAWLKSEENVLVTSIYLHRIANEYSLERIINAMEWLTKDWRWESTSILVRHVTVDWCDDKGDIKRAKLLRRLTENWATHFTATLITTILITVPYSTCSIRKRERFLKEFTKNWDFSKLSEFFMFLRSKANIDYKFKCIMLQQAARRDIVSSSSSNSTGPASNHHHHKRTSSHDLEEVKRNLLEEEFKENKKASANPSSSTNEIGSNDNNTSDIDLFNNRISSGYYASSSSFASTPSTTTSTEHILESSNPHQSESSTTSATSNLQRYHHHLSHTNLIVKK